ncbi:MAG: helix-turn-helix domain-containing protein [Candidatus Undinarchaeales archaeon]|jgi:sugar-specific transcriptional regulator TrmB|nr:helix-turn-helix domain-containing protein [Candidatus Undinarchaeales archaeon]MDP7493721.1 helix-turn-helix domain-containing protein [Candidatus Undinarchaeales archaeon]
MLKISERLLNAMTNLGLGRYEVLVYPHLLMRESATVSDLYDMLKIPKARIYEALDMLEKRGFIYKQDIKPIRYIAVEPDIALKEHTRSMIDALEQSHETARAQLASFAAKSDESASIPEFWFIHGRSKKYLRIDKMMNTTENEVRITVNEAGLGKMLLYESKSNVHQRLRDEGKPIRMLVFDIAHPEQLERAKRFADVRMLDAPLPRIVIVDKSEMAMLLRATRDSLTISKGEDIVLFSKNADFVSLFCGIFDTYWDSLGKPV